MSKRLLGNNIDPKCAYCKFGTLSSDGAHVLCEKKGILDTDYSCKKYCYDPLKREPKKTSLNLDFQQSDFEL